jgi:carbamoyltransferase
LCLAGGVALNCVANGRLLRDGPFKNIWIQPAAGDAGGALGAALMVWHVIRNQPRAADGVHDRMHGSYLGPAFDESEIEAFLQARGYPAEKISDPDQWAGRIADLVAAEQVVGLVQGRMEFGPRALGNRSIIGDARSANMQSIMNLKIKYRESFRPFAPTCLEERVGEYFDLDRPSPYMLLVAPVRGSRRRGAAGAGKLPVRERIKQARSDVPAITHVDYSARIQSVSHAANPGYYRIIRAFEKKPGTASSSTPRSMSAANRSSARRKTPTGVLCARKWTRWSWVRLSWTRNASRPGGKSETGRRITCWIECANLN